MIPVSLMPSVLPHTGNLPPPPLRSELLRRIQFSVYGELGTQKRHGQVRCSFLLALIAFPILGQRGTGELRLVVKDPAGAALAASVELLSVSTQTRQALDLPADGRYNFKSLPFGLYRLRVEYTGFAPSSQLIEIRSEIPITRQITLGLAPIETALQVTESDTLVDPHRTGAAYHVGAGAVRDRLSSLPGRDILSLVANQPGWLLEANGVLHPRGSEYDAQYIIDGFPVQDNRSPAFAPSFEADEVQSLKVFTSSYPAEYGKKLGGIIEVTSARNWTPGLHGTAVFQGGSFSTASGYLSGQYVTGRTSGSLSAEGFLTERYLDPPVRDNFSNYASNGAVTGTLERDFSDSDRVRVSVAHRQTGFRVPNERLQEAAGQRQDRMNAETAGRISYQHVFSPELLGQVRVMARDVSARLWSNPFATPISADQDRGFREIYGNGSLSGHHGAHEWKTGVEASFASIREGFDYRIVTYRIGGTRIFDRDTPPSFFFSDQRQNREQSGYVQDLIRLGSLTLSAGLRFDHYRLLLDESGLSPRVGLSWYLPYPGLVLHASYDRTFGTPAIENILLSGSPAARELNDKGTYLPLHPSRGNFYEAGIVQGLGGKARLDANYFRRAIRNFGDDDLLLNTGVSFPIAFHGAVIRGVEVKLEVPRWGSLSGFISYANMLGTGELPIAGGLFLKDTAGELLQSHARFPITQDQRNTARCRFRYELSRKVWTAAGASYGSGLPVEIDENQSLDFLTEEYGAAVVRRVNFDRGRVRPSFSLDASLGAELWRHEKRSLTLQADALNLTNRLNVINFAGLLSGTALGLPRSFGIRLRSEF